MAIFNSLISTLNALTAKPAMDGAWVEGKHPRDDGGQFAAKGTARTGAKGRSNAEPVNRVYKFEVGGVNSSREEIETTAPSFAKAVGNASHRAANGSARLIKQTWVRPLSVDGQPFKRRVIIDNENPNRTKQIAEVEAALKSFFDGRLASGASHASRSEQGNAASAPDQPDARGARGVPDEGGQRGSGPLGRDGHPQEGAARPGELIQEKFAFAQDSYPMKKEYYRELVDELRKIAGGDKKGRGTKEKGFVEKLVAALAVIALPEGDERRYDGQGTRYEGEEGRLAALARYLTGENGSVKFENGKGEESREDLGEKGTLEGEKEGAAEGPSRDTQTRTREEGEKSVVISTEPVGEVTVEARMTPKEVREMIEWNCSLIKTVDKDLIPGIERRIKRLYEHTNTTRDTLARYLEKKCGLEDWQAERIINDQMNKYDARARLELLKRQGVKLVRWVHGDCHEPRPSHISNWPRGLNGCVFPIDEPPVDPATGKRIYPGDEINCHCYLEAVE